MSGEENGPTRRPTVDLEAPDVVKSTCEFCGQDYWIIPSEHGIGHAIPMCAEFTGYDVIEYLQANREIKERKRVKA